MSIMGEHKQALQHFTGPTVENDLGRLNEKQISTQQNFTKRANAAFAWVKRNGIPLGYARGLEEYKRANAPINFEDLYALDTAISQTIWDADVFSQLGIPTMVMDTPKWQIKDYLVKSEEWPQFTKDFGSPVFLRLNESSAFTNGIGLHLGLSIPFTEIRESQGGLWSPQAIMMQELSAKMGLQKSRRGFLGTSCKNAYGSDGSTAAGYGITGLYNYASAQTVATGLGGDNNVVDQGDIEYSIRALLTSLKTVYQPGKYVIVSTSGFASQMFIERDTYQQKLDSERVKEILSVISKYGRNATGVEWWVTEQLYSGTPAVGQQCVMIAKVGPSLMTRKIIYNTQMLPMANKTYEGDLQENMIFADALQIKKIDTTNNAVPIVKATGVITADTTGFIPDGVRIL